MLSKHFKSCFSTNKSNYTHSTSSTHRHHQDQPTWFLRSFGAPVSDHQTREYGLSGSPLPPPSFSPRRLNCPLTVNSSVSSLSCRSKQSLGRVHPAASRRRRRRRAREVHLLRRSSRHSNVGGPRPGANRRATLTPLCSRCVRRWMKTRKQWESRACAHRQSGE